MKAFKSLICFAVILILLFVPFTASAVDEDLNIIVLDNNSENSDISGGGEVFEEFSLTFLCQVNGTVPEDAQFVFSVSESTLIFDDERDMFVTGQATALEDFTVSTKDLTNGKQEYIFPEKVKQGGFYYVFTLKSCSDTTVVADTTEVRVSFFGAESIKAEAYRGGTPVEDMSFVNEPSLFTYNCVPAATVNISVDGCEAFTKVYDGKLSADISDKHFKLVGIPEGDDVKLTYEKAEFNSADVKTASKITVSGLKLTGKDAGMYALSVNSFEVKGTVTKRPLTVTADNLVMTLGQKEPTLTYTLSEELIEGNKAVGTLTRTEGTAIGKYAVTRGTLSFGDNYEVTFVDGSLTISNFTLAELKDAATSIKVSGYFAPNSTLKITSLDPQSAIYTTLANETSWGDIISSYDIMFESAGHDGNLTVTIPVDSKYEGKELAVYQQLTNGSIACYKLTAVGGVITVKTDECTQFMLVADKEAAPEEETSIGMTILKIIIIVLAVIIGLALVIVLFFFAMIFFNKTEQLKAIIRSIRRLLKK